MSAEIRRSRPARARNVAITIAAVVLLTGCTGAASSGSTGGSHAECVCQWPMYRGDAARDGHPGGLALTAAQARTLKVGWSAHLDGAINGTPVVAPSDGRLMVIATTEAGEIAALSENTGRVFWQRSGLGKFFGSPAVEGGSVIAATLTGHVYAFDISDGRTLFDWTAPGIQPAIWSSPGVFYSAPYYLAIVGVGSQYGDNPLEPGRVVALHVGQGNVMWGFCVEAGCAPGGGVWSSVAADSSGRGFVGTGNPDDGVIAFDIATGRRLWSTSLNADQGRDLDVGATPVVMSVNGREVVAVGSDSGVFAELDASSGSVIWSRSLVEGDAVHGLIASPAFDGERVYVPAASIPTGIFALDPHTGRTAWQHRTDQAIYSAPAVGDGAIVFGTGDVFGDEHRGAVLALSTSDGTLLWSYDAHSSVFSSPAIVATTVIVGDTNGDLLAFVPGASG